MQCSEVGYSKFQLFFLDPMLLQVWQQQRNQEEEKGQKGQGKKSKTDQEEGRTKIKTDAGKTGGETETGKTDESQQQRQSQGNIKRPHLFSVFWSFCISVVFFY